MIELLGGRLFPGVHHAAEFAVIEKEHAIDMQVRTNDGAADISLSANWPAQWAPTGAFQHFDEASDFFRQGDCGFSCSIHGDKLEGMRLRTLTWKFEPIKVTRQHSAFYSNSKRFPKGSVEFDCAFIMRSVPHEWHELSDIPELATV
jgi:hypothetical protein